MVTDVVTKVGNTNTPTTMDYSSQQAWENASPTNCTTSRTGTTVAGSTSSTIALDLSASGTTDFYKGHPVWADARPAEIRLITAYNGTTKIATIGAYQGSSATWANTPLTEAFTVDACNWIQEAYDQGEMVTAGTNLTVSGQTVSATARLIARCATGASFSTKAGVRSTAFDYSASNGVAVRNTGSYAPTLDIQTDYTQVIGFQIKHDASDNSFAATQPNAATHCVIDSTILKSAGAAIIENAGLIKQSLLISSRSTADGVKTLSTAGSLYGCTVVNTASTSGDGISQVYAGHTVKNTAIFGFTNASSAGNSFGGNNNATDKSSVGFGTSNQTSLTFASQFTSSSNDFRAASGGGLHQGTPDSTNSPVDVTALTRSASTPWIGAWEVAAAGGHTRIGAAFVNYIGMVAFGATPQGPY